MQQRTFDPSLSAFSVGGNTFRSFQQDGLFLPGEPVPNLWLTETSEIPRNESLMIEIHQNVMITQIKEVGAEDFRNWNFKVIYPDDREVELELPRNALLKAGEAVWVKPTLWQDYFLPRDSKLIVYGTENDSYFSFQGKVVFPAHYQKVNYVST